MHSLKSFVVVAALAAGGIGAPASLSAQETPEPVPGARNAVYLELLGNGLIYSFNYERRITPAAGVRAGIGGFGTAGAVPVMFTYLLGGTRHHLDLGVGPLLVFGPDAVEDEQGNLIEDPATSAALLGTGTFGYRFQPDDGGFVFRIGLTPLFSFGGILPWVGMSLGYAF